MPTLGACFMEHVEERVEAQRSEVTPVDRQAVLARMLGAWCHTFVGLALHGSHRVRAGALGVNEALAGAGLKRTFLPYLPTLLPVATLLYSFDKDLAIPVVASLKVDTSAVARTPVYLYSITAHSGLGAQGGVDAGGGGAEGGT
jgi:hypothetical protein